MALILIRGESDAKLLNAIGDIERHASLNIISQPKVVDSHFADSLVEEILNSELKTKSSVATAFFVKEDPTLSIIQIKKIHPPAHVVVVSDEYEGYGRLDGFLDEADAFQSYRSHKAKNDGLIDYSIKGEKRHIKNEKLNSYIR